TLQGSREHRSPPVRRCGVAVSARASNRSAAVACPDAAVSAAGHAVVRRPDRLAARAVDQARMASGLCRYGPGASAEVPLGGSLSPEDRRVGEEGCTLHRQASTGRSVRCEPFASRWSNRLALAGGGTAGGGGGGAAVGTR